MNRDLPKLFVWSICVGVSLACWCLLIVGVLSVVLR